MACMFIFTSVHLLLHADATIMHEIQHACVTLIAIYLLGKYLTHTPQLILGCVFSWGTLIALHAPALNIRSPDFWSTAGALHLSCIAWNVFHVIVYAAQELKDDLKTGINSPNFQYRQKTRHFIMVAAVFRVILLTFTDTAVVANTGYYLLNCGVTISYVETIVARVDMSDPQSCMKCLREDR